MDISHLSSLGTEKMRALAAKYDKRTFFKSMFGDLPLFLPTLKYKKKTPCLLPIQRKFARPVDGANLYAQFYQHAGKRLRGKYLILIVKDLHNSDFKNSGVIMAHSWYGYFVRAVTFPCTEAEYLAQIKDASVPYEELFEGEYEGAWVLNDHSAFADRASSFTLRDDELYFTSSMSLNTLRWIKAYAPSMRYSYFHLNKDGDSELAVTIMEASLTMALNSLFASLISCCTLASSARASCSRVIAI